MTPSYTPKLDWVSSYQLDHGIYMTIQFKVFSNLYFDFFFFFKYKHTQLLSKKMKLFVVVIYFWGFAVVGNILQYLFF